MRRPEIAIFVISVGFTGNVGGVRVFSPHSVLSLQHDVAESPQPDSSGPAKSQSTPMATPRVILKDATPVQLRFGRMISSSQVIAGDRVYLPVAAEVRIGDLVVVPKESIAEAVVTLAQAKRAMARGGNLEIKIETVRLASGEAAPLRMIKDVKGGGHQVAMVGGVVGTALVLPVAAPFLLLVKGKDAVIPKGTEITAYVDGDVSLDPAKFLPAATAPQAAQEEVVPQQKNEPK